MLRLTAMALVAGAIAGAGLLYVTGGFEGNGQALQAATAGDACDTSVETAARVGAARGGAVAAMLASDPPISVASLAFDGPDGAMTLADMKGKTLLVNLWATWCAPCRAEMPALDRLQSEKGSDSFEVVAINIDRGDGEKVDTFLNVTKVTALRRYRDETMGVFNSLKKDSLAIGLPVTLLVDAKSCVVGHMNGPAEWDTPEAIKMIEAVAGAGS
jgi:thiol-disulfide isomerase/thioredoxin